jgi:hypothetical protein
MPSISTISAGLMSNSVASFVRNILRSAPIRVTLAVSDHKRVICLFAGKEKKKAQKTKQALAESTGSAGSASGSASVSQDDLRAALAAIRKEPIPATPDEKEAYFMDSVSAGEALLLQGTVSHQLAYSSIYLPYM